MSSSPILPSTAAQVKSAVIPSSSPTSVYSTFASSPDSSADINKMTPFTPNSASPSITSSSDCCGDIKTLDSHSPQPPSPLNKNNSKETSIIQYVIPSSPQKSINTRRLTRSIPNSCVHCKKSHLACEMERPCNRCVRTGRADSCVDAPHKKRGRKPKSLEHEAVMLLSSATAAVAAAGHASFQLGSLSLRTNDSAAGVNLMGAGGPIRSSSASTSQQYVRVVPSNSPYSPPSAPLSTSMLKKFGSGNAHSMTDKLAVATAPSSFSTNNTWQNQSFSNPSSPSSIFRLSYSSPPPFSSQSPSPPSSFSSPTNHQMHRPSFILPSSSLVQNWNPIQNNF